MEDASDDKLLQERVATNLTPLVDKKLTKVIYWCLHLEMEPSQVDDPFQYLGGEVELTFEDGRAVRVTWANNPPEWKARGEEDSVVVRENSVVVRTVSSFIKDALEPLDAGETHVWKPLLETKLQGVDVVGDDGVPYLLIFRFDGGIVYMGSGSGRGGGGQHDVLSGGFGDLDDVLVWSPDEFKQYEERHRSTGPWPPQHLLTIGKGEG